MTRVLVIAELNAGAPAASTRKTIGAARQLAPEAIDVAILAADGASPAREAAGIEGVTRVRLLERTENETGLAAVWAPQIAALADEYTHVLAPATTFGADILPRVAALLGVGALTGVTGIHGPTRFSRPIYAGNAIVTVESEPGRTICATIRPTAFESPGTQSPAGIEAVTPDIGLPAHTRLIERRPGHHAGPDLQTAGTVVAGGRGLGGDAGVELICSLAAELDAAVGASRAAVDSGWMGNDLQVGQTGKIVAPPLYIGIGISGAIQHLTGIRDAGTIVAINTDPEAPLCKVADIALIGDLFAIVPEMVARLGARKGG